MIDELDIHLIMGELSQVRPIFHCEEDFQHALAQAIRETVHGSRVLTEFDLFPQDDRRSYLDIWLADSAVALELKYKTRALTAEVNGDRFELRDQGAQNQGRYDFLNDVQRLERATREGGARAGYAIMLTNDSYYWCPSVPSYRSPNDAAFRIHEGRWVHGELRWIQQSGGTKDRESPIRITGGYAMRWRDYPPPGSERNWGFRYLAVAVGRG